MATFLLAYIFTFPMGWLISDVYSYMNQGIAIANGEKMLTYTDAITKEAITYNGTRYPLGNAFWIALWIKLCSLKYVYVGGLFSVLGSTFLIYKVLAKELHPRLSILLLFIYPSLAFFSNSLMSSIPSLIIISIFIYGLFIHRESGKKWFFLSFIAALSFWIRETNLVLLGSICLIYFIQDRRWFVYYVGGTLLGFMPRLVSSHFYYGDMFQYVLAENFSIQNFFNNIGIYAILLLCFMPLGLYFIGKYRGRYYLPLIISSSLFMLMYSFYSFNATEYSGFKKGIILMGRFMIPILPIYIIAVGWYFRKKTFNKIVKIVTTTLICILIVVMQYFVHREAEIHKQISNHIYSNYDDKIVMYDLSRTTNIVRYINPFHGNLSYISNISNLEDKAYMKQLFENHGEVYLIQTLNTANLDKTSYTSKIDELVQKARDRYEADEIEKIKIKPKLFLQVVKIMKNSKMENIGVIKDDGDGK